VTDFNKARKCAVFASYSLYELDTAAFSARDCICDLH